MIDTGLNQHEHNHLSQLIYPIGLSYISSGTVYDKQSTMMLINRYFDIVEEFAKYNLPVRSDSTMIKSYIINGIHEIDHIVQVMLEMKFLYECTDYSKILKQIRHEYRDKYGDNGNEENNRQIAKSRAVHYYLKKWWQ